VPTIVAARLPVRIVLSHASRTGLVGKRRCRRRRLAVLGLALLIAGCGSGTRPSVAPHATFSAQLARLREILPPASAKLPSPTNTRAIERDFLTAIADDTQRVWRREFAVSHLTYRPARIVVFSGRVRSDCGDELESGAFYCTADRTVYLDVQFFLELPDNAGVGSAAQAYIVGHEFGHHVQHLLGITRSVVDANRVDPKGENARSVRFELQADCLAGVWGHSAYPRSELTIEDLRGALKSADVIGDDYLQRAAGYVVDSALWTHGSSQQRQYWVRTGYRSGRPSVCDTFASR